MKDRFSDTLRAALYSLLLHGILALLIGIGLWWTSSSRPVVMPGPVIEASLVGPSAAPKPSARKPRRPAPPPKPAEPVAVKETKPEPDIVPPPEPPKQDLVDQQRVAALAEQKAEQARQEQEEKRRREQILLEQEKREAERMRKLEEVRKQLAEAERRKNLEKERLQQLQDKRAAELAEVEKQRREQLLKEDAREAQTGAGGADEDLRARYAAAIQAQVTRSWNRPESVPPGLRCTLRIVQIPGGDVISVNVTSPCNADAAAQLSIEQAVMRAAPLPYRGYEKVFSREIQFNFKYDGQD